MTLMASMSPFFTHSGEGDRGGGNGWLSCFGTGVMDFAGDLGRSVYGYSTWDADPNPDTCSGVLPSSSVVEEYKSREGLTKNEKQRSSGW